MTDSSEPHRVTQPAAGGSRVADPRSAALLCMLSLQSEASDSAFRRRRAVPIAARQSEDEARGSLLAMLSGDSTPARSAERFLRLRETVRRDGLEALADRVAPFWLELFAISQTRRVDAICALVGTAAACESLLTGSAALSDVSERAQLLNRFDRSDIKSAMDRSAAIPARERLTGPAAEAVLEILRHPSVAATSGSTLATMIGLSFLRAAWARLSADDAFLLEQAAVTTVAEMLSDRGDTSVPALNLSPDQAQAWDSIGRLISRSMSSDGIAATHTLLSQS